MAVAVSLLHPVSRGYMPVPALVAMAASALGLLMFAHRTLTTCWRIERNGRHWHLAPRPGGIAGRSMSNATLLREGFRSGTHLVLHFRDERNLRQSLTIWRGAVDPATFSLLRLALLDAAESPANDTAGDDKRHVFRNASRRSAEDTRKR